MCVVLLLFFTWILFDHSIIIFNMRFVLVTFFNLFFYTSISCLIQFIIKAPVLHDWCNKGRGMCYPVCGMVHIKEPLLVNQKE